MPTNQYNRERYRLRKEAGLCTRCPNRVDDGHPFCLECRVEHNKRTLRRRVKLGENNKCVSCAAVKEQRDKTYCNKCLEVLRKRKEEQILSRLAAGQCQDCGVESKRKRCSVCQLKMFSTNLFGTTTRYKDLIDIWEKQDRRCPYTGRLIEIGVDCELDHRVPRSKGGNNDLDNLQWIYSPINRMKHNLSEDVFVALIREVHLHFSQ